MTNKGRFRKYKKSIPASKIEAGFILEFNYKGEHSHFGKPWVVVLNPSWKKKLHGLVLDILTNAEVEKVLETINKQLYQNYKNMVYHKPILQKRLKMQGINHPQSYYNTKIRKLLRSSSIRHNPYRTYFIKNMTNIKRIEIS